MTITTVLFLLAIIAIGFICTYAIPTSFLLEERIVFGALLGTVIVSVFGFFVAWVTSVNGIMILITTGFLFICSLPLLIKNQLVIKADAASFPTRFKLGWRDNRCPKPVLLLIVE